jgi:hybrid cluster-associated redox disulfide protein
MQPPPFPEKEELLDIRVNEILQRWPAAIQVFLMYRMACIGCVYSRFDTLKEAIQVQGIDAEAFSKALLDTISGLPEEWETSQQ